VASWGSFALEHVKQMLTHVHNIGADVGLLAGALLVAGCAAGTQGAPTTTATQDGDGASDDDAGHGNEHVAGHGHGHGHVHGADPGQVTLVPFKNATFENAFSCDPDKGEKVTITYTIEEPARVGIRVLRKGTRELFLANIINFERRDPGTHVEVWDCKDFWGKGIHFEQTPFFYMREARAFDPTKDDTEYKGLQYEPGQSQPEAEAASDFKGRHDHSRHDVAFENVPLLQIASIKEGEVLTGKVRIKASVDKDRRGYGDKYGYGVRYYLGMDLVHEEFYEPESDGKFEYVLDTTAYENGKHIFYVGMCDHNEHATSQGVDVTIRN